MSDNKTSQAMKEMAKHSMKGFVFLNEVVGIAEKYKKMEEELEWIDNRCDEPCSSHAREALNYDPLND